MSEESVKVASLVEKLAGWVEVQPEYPYLFLADRGRRKRAARIVAGRLLIIPTVKPDPAGVDRATFRKSVSKHSVPRKKRAKMMSAAYKRRERLLAKQRKDRDRFMRLSVERAHELAHRYNEMYDERAEQQRLAIEEMQRLVAEGQTYDGPEFEYADDESAYTEDTGYLGDGDGSDIEGERHAETDGSGGADGGDGVASLGGLRNEAEPGPQGDAVSPDGLSE